MTKKKSDLLKRAKRDLTLAQKVAKWEKKQAEKLAKIQAKEMRPYLKSMNKIDLRRKLTPSQKGLITRAHNDFMELTARPHKIYRPKSKSKLRKVQNYSNHEKGKTNFDVAFVPTPDPKARVTVNENYLTIVSNGVREKTVFFNQSDLMNNPDKEIARAMRYHNDAKTFIIMAGKYEFNGTLDKVQTPEYIKFFMTKYGDETANNYYQNWMHGLKAYYYSDITKIQEYQERKRKEKTKMKRQRRNKRVRNMRTYGRKN